MERSENMVKFIFEVLLASFGFTLAMHVHDWWTQYFSIALGIITTAYAIQQIIKISAKEEKST